MKSMSVKKIIREQSESSSFVTLASYLLHSQTQVHVFHLQTDSYAEHKALQDYYEAIDGLMDSLIEAYQGMNGIVEEYKSFPIKKYGGKEMIISYFENLKKIIDSNRESADGSHLQNIIDEIVELIASTLYKIKFLK
jgi:hypothetical protein